MPWDRGGLTPTPPSVRSCHALLLAPVVFTTEAPVSTGMRKLTMQNGRVLAGGDPPDLRLECVDCDERQGFTQRADDPDSVYRCAECGRKHSRDSLIDVNAAGVEP